MKYKKKRCQSQNFLDPCLLRERERESASETFSYNFDFYVVQTAERVYVIVIFTFTHIQRDNYTTKQKQNMYFKFYR